MTPSLLIRRPVGWVVVALALSSVPAPAQISSTSVITGTISVPGERDVFTFSLANRARYYFDTLTNIGTLNWSLEGPEGLLVNNRPFTSSDAGNASLLSLVPGFYRLTVDSDSNNTNRYVFRFVDLAAASLLTPGSVVTNRLAPANETDFYQYTANAGDRFLFNRLALDAGMNVWLRLIDPYGNELINTSFTDVNTWTQRVSGTFTLLIEGYSGNTGSAGYSFNLEPQGSVVIPPFTGTPITIGALVGGSLTNASTNAFTFSLGAQTRLVFDTQTNSPNTQWFLEGPPGLVVNNRSLNGSDGQSGLPILELPAGGYQLRVRRASAGTEPFHFRLLEAAAATLVTPGTPIHGTLAPSSETDSYRFTATAGSRFYFDTDATNGSPSAHWRLFDPFNNIVADAGIRTDRGPLTLTLSGAYTLLVEGWYGLDPGAVAYRFDIVPVADAVQTLTLGALTTGSISTPGQMQQYAFTLAANTRLYFDSRANNSLRWSLAGPASAVVNNRAFNSQDTSHPLLDLPAGDYTLTVTGSGDDTGAFAFRLFDLSGASPFTPGTPLTGTLNPANETDAYRFTAAAGSEYYFDLVSFNGIPNASWRCFDPYGGEIFGVFFADRGPFALGAGGTYTLVVEGYFGDTGSGSYTVNVVPVTDGAASLTVGSAVNGVIAVPGQAQVYSFTMPAPATLYFDSLVNNNLRWSLHGPTGSLVNNRGFNSSDASHPPLKLLAGNYTLTVTGNGDDTGGFAFVLRDFATAAPLTPGTPVSSTLDPANETDLYRFTATAGSEVYFDFISSSGVPNAHWRCFDPFGGQILDLFLGDHGPVVIPANGIYTLAVEGYFADNGSGLYTVNVAPVNDTTQPLTLGSVISGAIAGPGQSRLYTFTLTSLTTLYFDSQTNNNLRWTLHGPAGVIVNIRQFSTPDVSYDPLRLAAGHYTLTITGGGDDTDGYQFRLFDIATASPLSPGNLVGATLNPAGETDAYRFNVTAGDRFFFNWISRTGIPNAYWRLIDPHGDEIFSTPFFSDLGTNRLVVTGTYTLFVEGHPADSGSGSYQFSVDPVFPAQPPSPYTGTPLVIGTTINGNLPTATTTNAFAFTLAAPEKLFFDNLVNSGVTWTLEWPSGVLVNQRAFWSSDSADGNPLLDLQAGHYRLTVTGTAGAYSFRLLSAAGATAFTPGTVVSNSISPGRATALLRFSASAGARFYYDGRPRSGFTTDPFVRIYPPFGNALGTAFQADSDLATFSAPYTGEYIMTVEGRYNDTSASGNYVFLLQPVSDATNTFTVGDTVNGAIAHAGQRQFHQFSLSSPGRLFFDSLTGVGTLSWTLTGPPGTIINDRAFWSSDSADGVSLLNLPAGAYTIMIRADNTNALNYAFRLVDSSSATPFTPGTLVTNSLAPGISTRLLRFNATAGERFFFDGRPRSGFTAEPWGRMVTPAGALLGSAFQTDADLDTFSVPLTGDYLVAVEGRYNDTSTNGNISFLLHRVIDGTNSFAVGQTVNGAISVPGQRQFHRFSLAAPARLFFDNLSNSSLPWTLTGPLGVIVNGRAFWSSDSADGVSLLDLPAGDYTISVEASGATLGSYAFRLLNDATAASFTPGTLVTNSIAPGVGSALLRFNANGGDRFYFDGRARSGFTADPWGRIYTPLGDSLMVFQIDSDVDTFSVPHTGSYILAVEGRYNDTSASGNYSFLLAPNPPQPPTPLFDTNVAPDLRVTGVALTPPSGLQSGQSVTVSWTTRNDGTAATPGSFTERVTVRNTGTSQIIVNRTLFYDEATSGSINPGATRNRQLAITLPDGPSSVGNLEVSVTTDTLNNIFEQNGGGTAEANNATSVNTTTTLAPYPDLQVASLSVAPPSAWLTGSVVTVHWVTTNTGNRATAGSWAESLLVRNTNTSQVIVNTSTNYDAAEPGNGDIAPNGSRSRSLTFALPQNANAYGAFEVTVTTDSDSQLFEHNAGGTAESNNSRSLLSASAPDLVVNGLTVAADPSLQAGAELTITWNTANQGNVPADGVFYDRVVVRNTNTAEVLLNTALPYNPASAGNDPIAPGGFIPREHTFDLPDGARSVGRLEITVTADTFNQLVEHNGGGTGDANNSAQTQVVIAAAPYPDLVATNVIAPATGRPGQQVPFIWTVRNVGPVPAVGPWSDHLFFSTDNVIGGDQFLTSVFFSGTLNPGQSLTRTQQVTLPAFGTGNRYFVAEADASSVLFEERETNNAAIAAAATVVPATLTLTFSPPSVLESAGNQAVLATLTRNSDAASALAVTLVNTHPAKILMPANVTIPAGASSTNFFIPVVDDTIAESNVTAVVTAAANLHVAATNTLTVVENDSPALTLRLSAPNVVENAATGAVIGTLTRNAQTNIALVVTLISDRPGTLTVPSSVTIAAGQTNANFQLDPVDDDLVTGNRTVSILASASGFSPVSVSLSVLDNDSVALTLQLSETSVSESAINPAAVATITRSPVSSGLLRILLSTNGGGLVQVPSEILIPGNQPAVTFGVNIRDDALAFGSQNVNLVAQAVAANGIPIPGANAAASLNVRENDGPTLGVSINAAVIEEGANAIATVTRNTPPTNSLTITLSTAPPGQAALPASVVIPLGASSTNIIISGVNDATADGAVEVTVTASAPGFNPGSAPVTVTDIDVPDLAMIEVAAPASALTDTQITVIWSVTNSGLATAIGSWVDQVFLATDSQGANATLITSVTNQGPFAVGNDYSHSRSFLLPSDPGSYWVLIRTDAHGTLTEGSERNNAALSTAITVQPSYRATVSTTVDSAVSGTPIPLIGQTFYSSNGAPASFRTATVRINVNQTRRTFSVLSDASGNFSGIFQPIPGEAGVYTVGADHPRVRQDLVQDQFTLLGMAAVPWELNLRLAPNLPARGRIEVRNLSPLPLTGLTVVPENLPLDFSVNTSMTNHLAGSRTNTLDYEIVTSLTTPVRGRFHLLIMSSEGATLRVPVDFTVTPPTAQLVADPPTLDYGMLRGAQTLVQFDVINQGGVPSGELSVALPVVPWLSLVSTSPIPSLPPAGRSTLVLALSPADDLPLTIYGGTLVLIGSDTSLTVPFQFRALSEAKGDLVLTVTDEHTYYANGAPKVTNASIVLRDAITSDVITNGTSDANGEVRFNSLSEGSYLIEASAPRRSPTRGGVRVIPGITTRQEVFMLRQEVTYEWRVVPSVIEDHYRVVLEPQFEAEVPQPNLVVENPVITPLVFPGQVSQFAIRLRNTGLIALERVRIPVPNHPGYEITPLVTEIEILPAQTTVSVPVTMRVRSASGAGDFQAASAPTCPGDDCVIQIPIDTRFRCGNNFVARTATVTLHAVCVPDTGCDITGFLDTSSPNFFNESALAHRAEFDCLLGKMDECDKARIRGYLRSGDFGSVHFPPGALPPPLDGTNFGLSAFCVCGPQANTNNIFMFGTNLLNQLGFPNSGGAGTVFGFVAATVPGPCNAPFAAASAGPFSASAAGPGVCARVRLELSQDITMARAAFRGSLILDNGGPTAITAIRLVLDVRDASRQPAGSRFAVRGPTLSGITAVDGSGVVAAGMSGSVDYVFVPTIDAAPLAPAVYTIGGTLQFTLDGQALTVPLLPGEITVLPDARLQLEYFQQRDVFSDDPFTLELEPAEPFALGLRLKNAGAGIARNFQIASAAPRIIENEKGLLIDFQLLGARIDNQPLTPSFNLNLGDINPGQSKIVVWDMTSTLQGKFIDYRASFVHLDAFGATNISLIESVNVHEMIHVVRDDRSGADTLPDFLVNDSPDPNNSPDIVYLSNGSNAPVSLASNPVIDSPPATNDLQVQLTATMPAGWTYLRMPNPGPDFRLVSVRRSDGKQIRIPENAWTTDRTFPSSIPGALREKTLHLFDHDSTGIYTLTFGPIAQDTNAPTSAVTALAATSSSSFSVQWSGDDGPGGSGIAFFDIYVSVNGGTFSNWIAHTTQRSALFDGVNGNTYAFYSRATDVAGNQEITPASADAQTTASGMNTPPSLVPLADLTIDEGTLFTVLPTAIDTDVPRQTLTYSLLAAPAGTTIDGAGGFIRWQTGEAQGGTSNRFIFVVADNGLPSLSATQSFSVFVREVNAPPFFIDPASDILVDEETLLSQVVAASDTDLPAQALTWQIAPGAPVGMSIAAGSGLLTWLPGESRGPGEYPITVTVRDNGGQSASRVLRVIVREVNRPPDLAPIPTQATLVQTSLYVTNSATDPDFPAQEFFFSLAPGAPSGARIGRTNGVFSWTPSASFARSTNFVTVRVTDNGVPSLTSSRTFAVVVGDVLEVRLGTGIVLAGQTGSVPVIVFTSVPATNATFTFEVPGTRLGTFSLDPPAAPVGSSTLQSLGGNRYRIRLGAAGGQQFAGEQTLSRLRFVAASGQPSAFVPLTVSDVSALQTDGQPVPRALGRPGRVVYLGAQPLLEAALNGAQAELHLYAPPAPGYTVESTLNLNPSVQWLPFWNGPVNNLIEVLPLSPTNQAQFFRARTP